MKKRPPRRGRRLRVVLLVVGLALLATIVAFAFAQIHPTVAYLVAARDLPAGTLLSASDLGTLTLEVGSLPGGVLASDEASLLNRVVARPLVEGDPVQATHLCPAAASITCVLTTQEGAAEARLFKLATGTLPKPDGLEAGDKVDLYLTLHDPSGPLCTADIVQGLTIQAMAEDGSSMTFIVSSAVVSLLITAQHSGDMALAGAPPTEPFAVLSQGTTACPSLPTPGTGTPTPGATAHP